ncbi:MAG: RNA polymerase factor sigma-54 [Kiritimatiellae bacterium]|jgi:RNA polymerase sigma-54 factor|nr:RNA polymerase factor sigma-54 [Kiritimatiellia bacterium]NLD88861.1 RNA polymerase factor sigma-54 [Lentisphaerota bacterium]HPC20192.1 RNA polymerase factor sigma-54 [Kiritimatiellia bacterium]HQN79627.1 RNA polymerase factor sigma-54 [Kiritimatiellia bacterium]
MKQGLFQNQQMRQEMKLAPRMIQALRFLQAPWPELRELIRTELERNPVLEEKQGEGEATLPMAEPLTAAAFDDVDQENDFEPDDFGREIDALEKMLEPRPLEAAPGLPPPTAEAEEKRKYFLDSITAPPSLHAHLEEQLNESGLGEAAKKAGEFIIGNVDENGWLAADVAEIVREAGVPEPAVKEALAVVQEFDPPGVAARDLKECLLIQLRRSGAGPDAPAVRLVQGHLEALGQDRVPELAKAAGLTEAETAEALKRISLLDPKPGAKFSAPPAVYVTPEVEIRRTAEGAFVADMRRDALPRLRISAEYEAMLEDPETAEEARKYLADMVRSGRFVLDSLHQRRETIRKIAAAIAETQAEFFEHGISRLKPMTMSTLAERLGVHETTVGRAVSGKYVRTPQGVFELRFFFTAGLPTADGGSISTAAAKEAVAKLIAHEDIRKPLSDQVIADKLKAQGVPLARRTVAKYREQLGIPPAHKRK